MTETLPPQEAYARRAGINPRPRGWVDDWSDVHVSYEVALEFAATTGWSFWADISEFQPIVTSAYPYPPLCIRLDTGYRLDNNAKANHRVVSVIPHIEVLMGYVVFIPGQSGAILNRIKNAFGSQLEGIAPMVDMEAGAGFAGPGNHSTEVNDLVNELAVITGDREREIGYANSGDWSGNWPSHPSWLKRIIANYSSTIVPGYWAQQYHGGSNYPVPPGFPTACKPFGSWVDLNAYHGTHDQLAHDLGLDWFSMATEAQLEAAVKRQVAPLKSELDAARAEISALKSHFDQKIGYVIHGGDGHPNSLDSFAPHIMKLPT